MLSTVSYTHLDVYKRQIIYSGLCDSQVCLKGGFLCYIGDIGANKQLMYLMLEGSFFKLFFKSLNYNGYILESSVYCFFCTCHVNFK